MGLFGFGKKKNTIISTKLNGSSAKGRQESLRNLQQYHDDLKAYLDFKNGSIVIQVGKNSSKIVGTVDSKIVRDICSKYEKTNGLSCDILIGQNYQVVDSDGVLSCIVRLEIVPK